MRFPSFVGPSYKLQSLNASTQRAVNLYPEKIETGGEPYEYYLRGTPGYEEVFSVQNHIRGFHTTNGRFFVVCYSKLYEVFPSSDPVVLGEIALGTNIVGMSDNGFQLCIVTGDHGYIFTFEDNTLVEITADGWRGSNCVTFVDGRFYFVQRDSGIYFWSALYDGLSIDALNFATAEASPDDLLLMFECYQEVYAFGRETIEVYYDSGDADAPLQRIQGAVIEYGLAAINSVAKAGNNIIFLGTDNRGGSVVYSITGYQPQRISTFAVEEAMQSYVSTEDAVAYTYQEDGHTFYVINFSSANTTWAYDLSTGAWGERGYLESNGILSREKSNFHAYIFGNHYLGDATSGSIYRSGNDLYSHNGQPIKHRRITPHSNNELLRIIYHYLQIDMEVGVGNADDTNPQASLRFSKDGGYTWSNWDTVSVGKTGDYKKRVKFNRLGQARNMVFDFDFTCKTKVNILDCYISAQGQQS